MGEEKKDKANKSDGGEKKKDAAAAPPAAEQQAIVLKVDLHCAGCASKVKRAIRHAPGVDSVKTDTAANKVVVTGAADAAELKDRIEARAKKPVHIVSAGAGAGSAKKDAKENGKPEKKADGGVEKKQPAEKEKGNKPEKAEKGNKPEKTKADKPKDKEENKPKETKEETVTLKIRLHCDGCIDRIKRRVYKIKGVKDVSVDAGKDLVKVTGTMDAAALPGYLRDKLSRPVEVVAPVGKKAADGGDKKADKGDGEKSNKDGDKKDKSVAPVPMADPSMYQMLPPPYAYHVPYNAAPGAYYAAPPPNPAFYPCAGPAAYYPPPYASSYPAHAPQMFSDENLNACSVM